MTSADRARNWRAQRTAKGICHRCPRPATGYLCDLCARAQAPVKAAKFRESWWTARYLVIMEILAAGRCVTCGEPKDRFHPWRHRKCLKANLGTGLFRKTRQVGLACGLSGDR